MGGRTSTGGASGDGGATATGGTAAIGDAPSFLCGNWADQRDNFVNGNLLLSGLSTTDSYATVVAKTNAILGAFETTVGANSVRVPINEPTVSGTWWNAYKGVIDAGTARGMKVIVAYWALQNGKEADRPAYFAMWKTVVDTYVGNNLVYFEPFNEPWGYSANDWTTLAETWVKTYPTVPKGRIIIAGSYSDTDVRQQGGDSNLDGTLLSLHIYPFNDATQTAVAGWTTRLKMYLGNYAGRTIVTEWGAPMTGGADYSGTGEGNNSGSFISAMSTYLHDNKMGSCYWPVLRTGDAWSLSTVSGTGTNLTLAITNASGLARVKSAFNL
jgi:endoglucanase